MSVVHQFGDGGHVPVGVSDLDVAQITWSGDRDGVMFATMYNTGARVSEITKLNIEDLQFGPTTTLRIRGKGRKERVIPLWKKHQPSAPGLVMPD